MLKRDHHCILTLPCRLFNKKTPQKSNVGILSYINKYSLWIFFSSYFYIHIFFQYMSLISIDIIVRVFANVPGDQGSIPGQVIPKTQKMVLDASLLNIHHYKAWIKDKWRNPGKVVAPSPTPWCNSYWKGSLQVTLNDGWPTYLLTYSKSFSINKRNINSIQYS